MRRSALAYGAVFILIHFFAFVCDAQKSRQIGLSRSLLMKDVDRILSENSDLKALKIDSLNRLKRGGTQDGGGGGDFIEMEISYLLNIQVKKLHQFKSTIIQLAILSAQQMQILEDVLPMNAPIQKVCILALEKTNGKECSGYDFQLVISPSVWIAMSDSQKNDRIMQEIFRMFDPASNEKSYSQKRLMFEAIVSDKSEIFHRIDLLKTNLNAAQAIVDGQNQSPVPYSLEKIASGFKLLVGDKSYALDSTSAFYKVDMCQLGANQALIANTYGSAIFYREIRNLVMKCEHLVKNGTTIQTFWVSDKTNLVINCR